MSDARPFNWQVTSGAAGTFTKVTPTEGPLTSVVFTIQNTSGGPIRCGGPDGAFYELVNGRDYTWESVDQISGGTQSAVSSENIGFISDTPNVTVNVTAAVGV